MNKLLLLSFILLFTLNCNNDDTNDTTAIDCTEVACTNIYITLDVSVKDASGAPISLDSFEVLDKDSSENITLALSGSQLQMARESGQYPLYDDSFVSENQNSKRTLVFQGFINNEKVAQAEFIVEIDCCHVGIATGDTNITIN